MAGQDPRGRRPRVDELGMPARFGEPERFQPRLDVLGRHGSINEDFVLVDARRRGKADGTQEPIERSVEAAIEAIEQSVFVWREASVAGGRVKAGGAQGSIDALALPGSRARQIHRGDPRSLDDKGVPVVGLLPNASRAVAILQDGATLIAPDFLIAEVCNAAWRSARLGRISQAQPAGGQPIRI
jgi:hypothetical protein